LFGALGRRRRLSRGVLVASAALLLAGMLAARLTAFVLSAPSPRGFAAAATAAPSVVAASALPPLRRPASRLPRHAAAAHGDADVAVEAPVVKPRKQGYRGQKNRGENAKTSLDPIERNEEQQDFKAKSSTALGKTSADRLGDSVRARSPLARIAQEAAARVAKIRNDAKWNDADWLKPKRSRTFIEKTRPQQNLKFLQALTFADKKTANAALGLPPIGDRTFFITGSTRGIGRETARRLAKLGCKVIIHGSQEIAVVSVMQAILSETPWARLDGFAADLSIMSEVRDLASLVKERHPVIHGILHNAAAIDGAFSSRRVDTFDELNEHTIATNAFAPYLLTSLLIDNVKASGAGRIMFSSSKALEGVGYDLNEYLDDLNCSRKYDAYHSYRLSKLAMTMAAKEIHERYGDAPRLTVHAFDPGMADTRLLRSSIIFRRGPRRLNWINPGTGVWKHKFKNIYMRSVHDRGLGKYPHISENNISVGALTLDHFQEHSGHLLEGAPEIVSDDRERAALWGRLKEVTGARWPKMLKAPKERPEIDAPSVRQVRERPRMDDDSYPEFAEDRRGGEEDIGEYEDEEEDGPDGPQDYVGFAPEGALREARRLIAAAPRLGNSAAFASLIAKITNPDAMDDDEMMVPIDMRVLPEGFESMEDMVQEMGPKDTLAAFLDARLAWEENPEREPQDERAEPMRARDWKKMVFGDEMPSWMTDEMAPESYKAGRSIGGTKGGVGRR